MKHRYEDWNRIIIKSDAMAATDFEWFGGKRCTASLCWSDVNMREYIESGRRVSRINREEFHEIYARQDYLVVQREKTQYLWVNNQDVIDWFANRLTGEVLVLEYGADDYRYWFSKKADAKAFEAEFAEMMV